MKTIVKIKARRLILFLGLLVALPSISMSQQVTLNTNAPNVVAVGEFFNITLTLNTRGGLTAKPSFAPGFEERGTSEGESFMQSGNKVERYTIITFTLRALQEGKFTIGSATMVDENGKSHTSKPLTIEVIKQKNTQETQSGSTTTSSTSDVSTDVFIRLIPSRTSLYHGDNLTLTLKLYRNLQADIARSENFKLPTFDGFWTTEINLPEQSWQRENVDGKIYESLVLKSWTLRPQKGGALRIEPAEVTFIIRKIVGRNMLGYDYDHIRKATRTYAVTINVQDMPSGAPNSYTGAVGNFTMTAKLSKDNVTANDAVSLNVRISGSGNLSLIGAPKLTFPHDFEVFDSKKTQSGNYVNFEYPMIPRSAGTFTVAPVEFAYFDPSSGKYVNLISNPMVVEVEKDANSPQVTFTNPTNQRNVSILASDVRFIKNQKPSWQAKGSRFLGFKHFYPLYILSVILFALAYFFLRKKHKNSQNIVLMRNRKAKGIAKKRLKIAEKSMKLNNAANFYDELLKAVWGYIGDKFTLPVAELSRNNINELLNQRGVEQKDIDQLISIVDECEYARYAPGANSLQIHSLYDNTIEIMSKLEQKTK